jgi:hypothetical protein
MAYHVCLKQNGYPIIRNRYAKEKKKDYEKIEIPSLTRMDAT